MTFASHFQKFFFIKNFLHVPLYNLKQTFKSSDASLDTKLSSGNRALIVKRVRFFF